MSKQATKAEKITRYPDFWRYYLREHSKALTRSIHYFGTALVFVLAGYAMLTAQAWLFLLLPVAGYFFAWLAHFTIEKNRPATFSYPLWSLYSDFRMFFLWLSGRLAPHLRAAGVASGHARIEDNDPIA